MPNLSANSVISAFKMYLESDHFLSALLLPPSLTQMNLKAS